MAIKYSLDFPDFETDQKLRLSDKVFFIGSCFAENIATKFEELGMSLMLNPLGVVYNPHSIADQISRYCQGDVSLSADEIVEHEGLSYTWDTAHAQAQPSPQEFLDFYTKKINQAHQYLRQAQWVVISLGTSKVHYLRKSLQIVSNCHKREQSLFGTRRLTSDEMRDTLSRTEKQLSRLNPEIKILWTVSPVRYIREGLVESNRSKAVLLKAMSILTQSLSFYYPSYEILTDCLRDYRYYAEDLVHPSSLAIQAIYEHLMSHWLASEQHSTLVAVEKYNLWKKHTPLHSESEINPKIAELIKKIKLQWPDWRQN